MSASASVGTFVRGTTVDFTVVFNDAAGDPVNPTGATLTLAYIAGNSQVLVEINMTSGPNNTWLASWESASASGGKVDGNVKTNPPTPYIAVDFSLTLTKNKANVE